MLEENITKVIHSGREVCPPEKRCRNTIPYSNMIHFIESGQGYFNGILLGPGQGFICRKNHFCSYEPLPNNPWTYSWINIIGTSAEQILNMTPMHNDVFTWNPDTQLKLLSEIPIPHSHLYDKASELLCLSIFYRIFSELITDAKSEKADYAARLQNYLDNNYEREIRISRIADDLHISQGHLRNLFHEHVGMSPQEYLMNLRMKRAEFLLMSEACTITEVALSVGYGDILQFSRIFKKHHKVSPTEYRKRYLNRQ